MRRCRSLGLIVHDKQGLGAFDWRPRRRLGDVESVFTQDGDCGDVGWVVLIDLPDIDMLVESLPSLPFEGSLTRRRRRLLDHLPVVLASVLVDEDGDLRISGGTSPLLQVSPLHSKGRRVSAATSTMGVRGLREEEEARSRCTRVSQRGCCRRVTEVTPLSSRTGFAC
jgi:hypothetical protein